MAAAGFSRRELLRSVAVVGIGSLLTSCATPAPAAPTTGPTPLEGSRAASAATGSNSVVAGTNAEAANFNPILAGDGASMLIQAPIFEALIKADPVSGVPLPWLAERWDQSTDGLTYTFHLRPGVTWSDGQPFTASDVRFTFELISDPRTHTALRCCERLSVG